MMLWEFSMAEAALRLHSFAEYLALEEASLEKNEYFDGQILAMSWGTPAHYWMALQVGAELKQALRGKPCAAFNTDLRVRVLATGLCTYPDLSVICGPLSFDPDDRNTVTNPTVLVEVLSPSTERYDRGEKFEHYQKIPSLQDYVLVSVQTQKVEVFGRNADGSWRYTRSGPGEVAQVPSVGVALSVDALYDGMPVDRPTSQPSS
jgi:Uma2 family endonuclease